MSMEPDSAIQNSPDRASVEQGAPTPWGVIIALTLILVIIVSGAYYAFTKRFVPMPLENPSSVEY